MATLSARQIATVAKQAGFATSKDVWQKSVAIALAESSGRTDVVNSIKCVGLWQIYQPVHVKEHPTWTIAWLKNPQNNAQAAYVLSNGGTNWKPWQTYTTGAYLIHMHAAGIAIGDPSSLPDSGSTIAVEPVSISSGISGIGNFLSDADTWRRLGLFLAGALLLTIGAFKLTGNNQMSPTTKLVATVASKGLVK